MKRLIFLIFTAIVINQLPGNSAQPGIWSSGGFGHFELLFPEDSAARGKIKMTSEQVYIDIYKGFAVVKGVYHMKNLSANTLKFRAGYPLHSQGKHEIESFITEYNPDRLDAFSVRFDKKLIHHQLFPDSSENSYRPQVWYIWENTFSPNQEHEYTVHFIVEIKESSMRKGYGKRQTYPFIYITESGSTWLNPIGKADIMVRLMDGLKMENVEGVWPQVALRTNGTNAFYYGFQELMPLSEHNLVLALDFDLASDFSIKTVVANANVYFKKLDFLTIPADVKSWEACNIKDFRELKSSGIQLNDIIGFLPLVLGFAILGLVIFGITKVYKALMAK